jgi:pyrroloquinoline quinone biosynthesis protein D
VRLRFDPARDRHVLLAPERVIMPDETALAVLQSCDGVATVGAIADALAARFAAPRDVVLADCIEMLDDLISKGMVTA